MIWLLNPHTALPSLLLHSCCYIFLFCRHTLIMLLPTPTLFFCCCASLGWNWLRPPAAASKKKSLSNRWQRDENTNKSVVVCWRKELGTRVQRKQMCMFTCLSWSSLSSECSTRLQRLQQAIHDASFIILCKYSIKTWYQHCIKKQILHNSGQHQTLGQYYWLIKWVLKSHHQRLFALNHCLLLLLSHMPTTTWAEGLFTRHMASLAN